MTFQVLDLFSGAGGMAEGFLQAGFFIPYASDLSEQASKTYKNRHKQLGFDIKFFQGDVNELKIKDTLFKFLGKDIAKIDVITGGPPCQGFSLAGKRDNNDTRNQLVYSYIEILADVKPKYFVMENVVGLLSAKTSHYEGKAKNYTNEKITNILISEFKHIGYSNVEFRVLDASDFGVPQKRLRVIFLGTRNDINHKIKHPKPQHEYISCKEAIQDLDKIDLGKNLDKYNKKISSTFQMDSRNGRTPNSKGKTIPAKKLSNHQTSNHTNLVIKRFSLLKSGENIGCLLKRLPENEAKRLKTKKNNCKRMVSTEPSPTILTLPDDMIHYSKDRILTVREMARLQSFDDSFEFLGKRTTGGQRRKIETPQYTLVGNAVPPLLAKAIADEIMKCLKAEEWLSKKRGAQEV